MDREQLLNHVREFLAEIGAEEGYLFGSRARGDELLESDVDLLIVSDKFRDVKFPWRLVMLQEHWHLPHFLEALPYTREELTRLSRSRGMIIEALRSGIRIIPTSATLSTGNDGSS